ncbi:MAG: hypothetical protein DI568_03245 [Sphingomonas sp.]|nr:MAG: hypothetical protein DI568_03245 [Sphingomonas sp.]
MPKAKKARSAAATLFAGTALCALRGNLVPAMFMALTAAVVASPSYAANFNVASDSELRDAIDNASNGDTITFTSDITLEDNLPFLEKNLTIIGGNHTLSGDGQYRGLYVQSGTLAVNDLTIANTYAQGGNGGNGWGGGGGGGGAGLGAGIFVASAAQVSLSGVHLSNNSVQGGNGGDSEGDGGQYAWTSGGGAGYALTGADGGNANGLFSGGGGTGGGGDGADNDNGGNGGLGGGGGGSGQQYGGTGGLGGGGGGGSGSTRMEGGVQGGSGGAGGERDGVHYGGGGGGGAGLGGAIFVQDGGSLSVNGAITVSDNSVAGGTGGTGYTSGEGGGAAGAGMFLAGNGTLAITVDTNQFAHLADSIADQTGSGGTGSTAGSWSLEKYGTGTLYLTGDNSYSGGTIIHEGRLAAYAATTDAAYPGSIYGNVLNNAELWFIQDIDGTFSGTISGTGSVIKTGAGSLALTGNNSFTGTLSVQEGTLLFETNANLNQDGSTILLSGGSIGFAAGNGQVSNRDLSINGTGGIYIGSGSATWSGTISGLGALVVSGGGAVELTADNTYTGGTRIEGGHVLFTTDSNLGAAGAGVQLSGGTIETTKDAAAPLTIDRTIYLTGYGTISVGRNPLVWAGDISGDGTLHKSGDGVLQLTGNNSYTGGTYIQRGELQISSDSQLGAAGTTITMQAGGLIRSTEDIRIDRPIFFFEGGGGFHVEDGKTIVLGGEITTYNMYTAALTLVGTGTLVLDLESQPVFATLNNFGGTVQADTRNLSGNIAFDNNADNRNVRTILFDQDFDGTFAGNITGVGNTLGLGTIRKDGSGTLILSGNGNFQSQVEGLAEITILNGAIQSTTRMLQGNIENNAALIFDQDFDGTYAGTMSGTGTLTKNGTGRLNLTGASSVGGGTTINAGILAVNGPLFSNIVLNKGGTLNGVGNITGDITNNGGTINVGNSIGHLVVNGNFTLNSGTLAVEINAQGDADRISVIGEGHRVNIHAGTLEIIPEAGIYTPNTRYTIITTEAGGQVNFDAVTGGVGFLKPVISLDSSGIYVTLALEADAFQAAGVTANQQAVGGALDAIAATGSVGGVITTMANLPTTQGAAALQTLSGQPYANLSTVNLRASQLFANAVGRQMAVARGVAAGGSGDGRAALGQSGSDGPSGFSVWISGLGSTGGVDGDANASGLDYSLWGTAFGLDYSVAPGLLLGVAGGYVSGSMSVDGFAKDTDSKTLSIVGYGSFAKGPLHIDALAGYANARNSLDRVIASPDLETGRAKGKNHAGQFLGQIGTGYRFDLGASGRTAITPFARLQMVSINQRAFTETGSSDYNLTLDSRSTTSVRSSLGADVAAGLSVGKATPLDLGLRLGWAHEFGDPVHSMTAAFASSPAVPFTVRGAALNRDSALIGASMASRIGESWSLFVSYDGELGGGNDHQFRGGIKITW